MEKVYTGTPPYNERDKLYLMHFCFAFVSRMWDLGIVLLVATITNNSLFVVSMMGFVSALVIFLVMSLVGSLMDRINRLVVVQFALVVKVSLVSVVYYWCYQYESFVHQVHHAKLELYCIPLLVSLVAVCFSTVTQSVEKDWVVVLSSNDSAWLAVTNSTMSQIDLLCATIAPVLTGLLFEYLTVQHTIVVLALTNALATVCLMWFLRSLYVSFPSLAVQPHITQSNDKLTSDDTTISTIDTPTTTNAGTAATAAPSNSWSSFFSDFLECGCCGVLVSYSLLYLTCLSFGSIMITYLRSAGVTPQLVGAARGGAAVVGCIGAAAFPKIRQWMGGNSYSTGQVAIVVQAALACLAASTFFWSDRRVALAALMCSLLYIRTWVFDLSVRQIAQESIREAVRGRVNGQWKSLMAFFELAGFGLAMMLPDPHQFWILCLISASFVLMSLVLFTLSNPNNRDRFCDPCCNRRGYQRIAETSISTTEKVAIDKQSGVRIEMLTLDPVEGDIIDMIS